jgi:hypothetical protein
LLATAIIRGPLFETLNPKDFLGAIKTAFPKIDSEKAYKEFRAEGEKEK